MRSVERFTMANSDAAAPAHRRRALVTAAAIARSCSSGAGCPFCSRQYSYRNIYIERAMTPGCLKNEMETRRGSSRDLPKAITGRPSSARHKLSDPFLRASRSLERRYQLLRARADSHEPRVLQAAPTSHAPSGHGGHPCPAEPKMGDLLESVLLPLAKASPQNRC
jgi:hypothetical protein